MFRTRIQVGQDRTLRGKGNRALVFISLLRLCLQAHAAKHAIQWVNHLRALVRYWRLRHAADAKQEMDVVHYATGKPRVTPARYVHEDKLRPPDALADEAVVLPYLSMQYNWCLFNGCKPVGKTGRIYVRDGLKGKFK